MKLINNETLACSAYILYQILRNLLYVFTQHLLHKCNVTRPIFNRKGLKSVLLLLENPVYPTIYPLIGVVEENRWIRAFSQGY